jgi:hypothetical protein
MLHYYLDLGGREISQTQKTQCSFDYMPMDNSLTLLSDKLLLCIRHWRSKVKAKVKLSLCLTKYHTNLTKHHAMRTYWESRGEVPRILNICTRRRRTVSFTPRPGKSSLYPTYTRLDGGPRDSLGSL